MQRGVGGGMPSLGGLAPQQLGMGAVGVFMLLRMLGVSLFSPVTLLLGGLGYAAYQQRADGLNGMVASGRSAAKRMGEVLGRTTGRPVSEMQAMVLVAGLVFLAYRYLLGGGGSVDGTHSSASERYAAYTKGFQDGKAGALFDPISDAPVSDTGSSVSSGGFSFSKMMSLIMVGSMVYQMGGGGSGAPWNINNVLANARNMNPLNLLIMLNMLSGLLW